LKASITILVDNRTKLNNIRTEWGLSIHINTADFNILFDTGPSWKSLYENAQNLGIDLSEIDFIVISHWHRDHSGALSNLINFLESKGKEFKVIVPPTSFSYPWMIEARTPFTFSDNILTTGTLPEIIPEQSLILRSRQGPMVLVGCSHPGLDRILERVCSITGSKNIFAVIGGYHIGLAEARFVKEIFEKFNVSMVGPCHCTSDDAIEFLKKAFGNRFIEIYTGKRLDIELA